MVIVVVVDVVTVEAGGEGAVVAGAAVVSPVGAVVVVSVPDPQATATSITARIQVNRRMPPLSTPTESPPTGELR
jgi:hypothetical protein